MNIDSKILVLGSTGMVGSAIVRKLQNDGYNNLLTPSHDKLDLTHSSSVRYYFEDNRPEYVFVASALVGGIKANYDFAVEFYHVNSLITLNVLKYSKIYDVEKLIYLGSSCIMPKECEQPIKEEYMLGGYLEPTNEMYALSKIGGIKLCQAYNREYNTNFISLNPCNLYGINDSFDVYKSHFIPAIMKRMHESKINNEPTMEVWGDGSPLREFMFVDDLADACVMLMYEYNSTDLINVGTGIEHSISDTVQILKEIIGYEGEIIFNTSKPNGTMRKVLDVSKINELGWQSITELKDGLKFMYNWYVESLMESGV